MPFASHPRSAQRQVTVAILILCHLNLTACSIFGGSSQPLTVNSEPPGANVLINGTLAGTTTPLQHQVPRRGDLTVEVQKAGYKTQSRMTGRKLSSVGIVDVIGGSPLSPAAARPHRTGSLGAGPGDNRHHARTGQPSTGAGTITTGPLYDGKSLILRNPDHDRR